ncbi:MAG: response regulator [Planctomycetota bacterium]
MKSQIKILLLEDSKTDAELEERELRNGDLDFISRRVESKEDFLEALNDFRPDLILSDNALPSFNGLAALAITQEKYPDVPFIFVSGTIGEDRAVESLKHGATDYVLKTNLNKLVPAVHRALNEAKERVERKKAEVALKMHSLLLDNSTDSIFLHDDQGRFIYVNKSAYETRGYTRDELMKMTLIDLDTPEYAKLIKPRIEEITEKGSLMFEAAQRRKNGSVMPVEVHASLIKLEGKKLFLAVIRDITVRKQGEEILKKQHLITNSIINSPLDTIIFALDREYRYVGFNENHRREMKQVYGADIHLGDNMLDLITVPEVKPVARASMERVLRGESFRDVQHQPNTDIWYEFRWSPIKETNGSVIGISVFVNNISDRKKAQYELERRNDTQTVINNILQLSLENISLDELLRTTLDMILAIPWLALESRGCVFLAENEPEALVMKAQRGIADILVKTCARVPFGRCLCGCAALTRKVVFADKVDHRHETRYDGIIPHGHYCVPIIFGDKTLGVINIYVKEGHPRNQFEEDFLTAVANTLAGIIDRRKMVEEKTIIQEQLLHAQKMDAVGRLAGGVAHDINNILTVIDGYCAMTLDDFKDNQPLVDNIRPIRKAVERAAVLTQQLLAFSRKQPMQAVALNFNSLITEMAKMFQRVINKNIKLIIDLFPELNNIQADRSQIEQVIMNLAINARDAMPTGGQMIIKTANISLRPEQAQNMPGARPGNFVRLEVYDTGTGMDQKTISHLFEPFFTTKERGKGTGLGLSVAYGIVKQHNGWINVRSEPGKGSVFSVYLPVAASGQPGSKPKIRAFKPITTSPRILVIEDDTSIMEITAFGLRKSGYQVFEASTIAQARKIFEREKGDFDVIFSDVVLPDGNGVQLVEELLAVNKKIRVILSSGYVDDPAQLKVIEDKGYKFLSKPYNITRLTNAILKAQ